VEWLNEYRNLSGVRQMRDTYSTGATAVEGYPASRDASLNDPLIQSKLLPISLYGRIAAFRSDPAR